MFKLPIILLGWAVFAVDAFLVVVAIVSRDMGDDAAGRGAGLFWGFVGLVFVLAGGAGLYFSGRAHSWPGVIGSIVPLALPLLIFFGTDVEAYIHKIRAGFESRKQGRYADPAQSPTTRVHAAALLMYLCGKTDEPFDWNQRPFFLRFASEDNQELRAAWTELRERAGI